MNRRYRSSGTGTLSVGWLFADLLLALAVLFLLTNTNKPPEVKAITTVTPTPTPSPTPTSLPRLELQFHRITLQIDANGLLNSNSDSINNIEQQIQGQSILNNRRVGLAIVYGGAPTTNGVDINNAQTIASKTYDVLRLLGQGDLTFKNTSYYDPLYVLGNTIDTVVVDVYLFAK